MKIIIMFFIPFVFLFSKSCYSQGNIYLNHRVLNTPITCESASKFITLNNGDIDSIVTRSGVELHTESPFTFIYLHTGKCVEKVGECIYYSDRLEPLFCILEPPCCAGNVFKYHWFKYSLQQDTIKQVCEVSVFTTTDVHSKDIIWHASQKEVKVYNLQLRSEPMVNDTEEDFELRQIGNVIFEEESKTISAYELGYNKKQPTWKLCAISWGKDSYLIGWYYSKSKIHNFRTPEP